MEAELEDFLSSPNLVNKAGEFPGLPHIISFIPETPYSISQ